MLSAPAGQWGPGLGMDVDGFEAAFVSKSGVERRIRWQGLPAVVGEIAGPVRSFRSHRGQRNFPGWYWSATTGGRVGFESWVERDHLVALDFDPEVVDVVSQPFWLVWRQDGGKQRRHAPDFLVHRTGARWLVLDSRPRELIGDRDRAAFAVMAHACAMVGWGYAVWDRLDPLLAANHRWLGGYRHPRCFDGAVARELLETFTRPRPLMDGAEMVGDPLRTLPVLYHLLWRQWLVADLSVVLSHRSVVCVSPKLSDLSDMAQGPLHREEHQ
ncbi:TnsA-like heteromeric transposase endonuclease subunit [Nocardia niigatensis]|uniref:TnsA-like heteromeric transposase endonuclease subunit n=1 Tax=Nocardia niigatensis TaxID=209249 RepID=UPI00030CC684|nr:TnsA-like heteromeric transposase endonuclease subunit [Nocardia niigatensis]